LVLALLQQNRAGVWVRASSSTSRARAASRSCWTLRWARTRRSATSCWT